MSSEFPPLTYREVTHGLKKLGFEMRPKKATAHEQWTKTENGKFYKVTVDKHESPFGKMLIESMAKQAGVSKKEFYRVCLDR